MDIDQIPSLATPNECSFFLKWNLDRYQTHLLGCPTQIFLALPIETWIEIYQIPSSAAPDGLSSFSIELETEIKHIVSTAVPDRGSFTFHWNLHRNWSFWRRLLFSSLKPTWKKKHIPFWPAPAQFSFTFNWHSNRNPSHFVLGCRRLFLFCF